MRSARRRSRQIASSGEAAAVGAADVRRVWQEIQEAVKQRKKRTAALLVSATVRAVENDTLVLSIGTAPLARLLSEQSNTDVIAEALHAVLGVRWRVRCEHGDGSRSAGSGAAAGPARERRSRPSPQPPVGGSASAWRGRRQARAVERPAARRRAAAGGAGVGSAGRRRPTPVATAARNGGSQAGGSGAVSARRRLPAAGRRDRSRRRRPAAAGARR